MRMSDILYPKVHKGVAMISWATAIRWIGWGFVDALLPIFIFSFAGTYAETGVLGSIYSIIFLISVPIVGTLANHIRSKSIILSGLFIYPFVALAYYLAGVWGAVAFIVIARGLNGIGFALDVVGRNTYLRKHTHRNHVGSAFGYMKTIGNFWWIAAVLASAVLINYFEIHELFLFIIPTVIAAIVIVYKMPKDKEDSTDDDWQKYITFKSYKSFFQEVVLWNSNLKRLALLNFFLGVSFSVLNYFMPIHLFEEGQSLGQIIIFLLIYSIPALFSTSLGWLADRASYKYLTGSFITTAVVLALMALTSNYYILLFLVFLASLVGTFAGIYLDTEMTKKGDPRTYGTITSGSLEILEISTIVGPIATGFIIDFFNIGTAFMVLAIMIAAVAFIFKPVHRELQKVTRLKTPQF